MQPDDEDGGEGEEYGEDGAEYAEGEEAAEALVPDEDAERRRLPRRQRAVTAPWRGRDAGRGGRRGAHFLRRRRIIHRRRVDAQP